MRARGTRGEFIALDLEERQEDLFRGLDKTKRQKRKPFSDSLSEKEKRIVRFTLEHRPQEDNAEQMVF